MGGVPSAAGGGGSLGCGAEGAAGGGASGAAVPALAAVGGGGSTGQPECLLPPLPNPYSGAQGQGLGGAALQAPDMDELMDVLQVRRGTTAVSGRT